MNTLLGIVVIVLVIVWAIRRESKLHKPKERIRAFSVPAIAPEKMKYNVTWTRRGRVFHSQTVNTMAEYKSLVSKYRREYGLTIVRHVGNAYTLSSGTIIQIH